MSDFRLTLVIPCYNELNNLEKLVQKCENLCNADNAIDVVLVDNGSSDGSSEIFAKGFLHDRINSIRVDVNQGYGFGILSGLRAAKGDVIGWTHADLQTDPMDAIKALECFRGAKDPRHVFVKGRRVGRPIRDVAFTWGMTAVASLALGKKLTDINAQPSLFHRDFFATWADAPNDFSLDLYAYALALSMKLDIERVKVNFGDRMFGIGHNESLISKLRYSRRTLGYIVKLRQRMRLSC